MGGPPLLGCLSSNRRRGSVGPFIWKARLPRSSAVYHDGGDLRVRLGYISRVVLAIHDSVCVNDSSSSPSIQLAIHVLGIRLVCVSPHRDLLGRGLQSLPW